MISSRGVVRDNLRWNQEVSFLKRPIRQKDAIGNSSAHKTQGEAGALSVRGASAPADAGGTPSLVPTVNVKLVNVGAGLAAPPP